MRMNRTLWEQEKNILILYADQEMSLQEIADMYGVSKVRMYQVYKMLGIERPRSRYKKRGAYERKFL